MREIVPFATTWMDLEGIRLDEINQTEKDKYLIISLISGIQKKEVRQAGRKERKKERTNK